MSGNCTILGVPANRLERHPVGAGVLIVAVLLGLLELAGQGYYRLRHGVWLCRDHAPQTRFTPYGLWELLPEVPPPLATDVNGFVHNGYDRPFSADAGKRLIFVLGGSTVYGMGASSNATTFPAQLEKKLEARHPGCCRVVNAGITAFFTYEQLGLVEGRLSQELSPDLVLALDGRNDALYASAYTDWKPNWSPAYDETAASVNASMRPSPVGALAAWLPLHSSLAHYLFWFVIRPALDKRKAGFQLARTRKEAAPSGVLARAAEAYVTNHEVARLRLARRGVPYYAFLQPTLAPSLRRVSREDEQAYMKQFFGDFHLTPETYYGGLDGFYEAARKRGKSLPWFVDLSRVFEKDEPRIYVDSCHYTDLADGVLAGKVAAFLETHERRLLKGKR